MENKTLSLLGLAQKARKIISGYDIVLDGIRKGKVKYVLVARDASLRTIDQYKTKCFYYKVELNLDFTTDEITKSIGKNRKILGIIDDGFAKMIKLSIGGVNNESKRNN